MTQTLRRELIRVIRKNVNEWLATSVGYLGEEISPEACEKIADSVLEISGIAKQEKKFSDPSWDLLHGKTPTLTEALSQEAMCKTIAERLEIGLRRNEFPQSIAAQSVYRWIAERERAGESLDTWIKWAMDGKKAQYSFTYHKDPRLIKRDWPQAFPRRSQDSGDDGIQYDAHGIPMSY